MLTGDKMETAVNIGKSCALIDDTLELHVLRGDSPAKVKRCLEDIIDKLDALDRRLNAQSGVDVDGESTGLTSGGSGGPNTSGGPNGNAVLISPKSRQKSEDIEMRSATDASFASSSSSAATAFVGASIVADGPALQFALAKVQCHCIARSQNIVCDETM